MHSVDTEEEAKLLLTIACETNLSGDYIARELAHVQDFDNLAAFAARLQKTDAMIKERVKR